MTHRTKNIKKILTQLEFDQGFDITILHESV